MANVVVLFSGGLDSTVLLYHLRAEGHTVYGLGVDYGQRHARELHHARSVAARLAVIWQRARIGGFLGTGPLTNPALPLPPGLQPQAATVVPGRNAVLLSLAASVAEALLYDTVAIAANATDHTAYPDCRPAFLRKMDSVIRQGTAGLVRVVAPFASLTKADIVRRGAELDVPFAQTWSCYQGGTVHCGNCGACAARQAAFREAGIDDPTPYEEQTCAG